MRLVYPDEREFDPPNTKAMKPPSGSKTFKFSGKGYCGKDGLVVFSW